MADAGASDPVGRTPSLGRASSPGEASADVSERARIRVTVRFFARFRELVGRSEQTVEMPAGGSVADLVERLRDSEGLRDLPERPAVAVNLEYAEHDQPLRHGDEVALIPPVAGGAGPTLEARIVDTALDPPGLLAELGTASDGALVLFVGRVRRTNRGRPVMRLEYEAYREMAERELTSIVREVSERHGAGAISAVHRVGVLEPGEPSVAIAVAAPHRAEAYAASREVMEAIKERLPVWKREVYVDGADTWLGEEAEAGGREARPATEETTATDQPAPAGEAP